MREEVKAAVNFLTRIMQSTGRVSKDCLDQFKNSLENRLHSYYDGHWFPEKPHRGSGYRCIRINHIMDPILDLAAQESGIGNLLKYLPNEITIWVDPFDVSYRIGENGSIGQIHLDAELDSLTSHFQPDLTHTLDNPKSSRFGVFSSCKDQLRELTSSKHANSVFTPFAAFVSS